MKASQYNRIKALGQIEAIYNAFDEIQLHHLSKQERMEIIALRKDFRMAIQRIESVIETVITEDDT